MTVAEQDTLAPELDALALRIREEFGGNIACACELEFLLEGWPENAEEREELETTFQIAVLERTEHEGLPGISLLPEEGPGQFEVTTLPTMQPSLLAAAITHLRALITSLTKELGLTASFEAKPKLDLPGNGMHFNLSLHDGEGRNLYYKKDRVITEPLKWSMGGLLELMPESMLCFAPQAESYTRFIGNTDSRTPVKVCWGANNRTTALRLPESLDGLKHIEHRVPGADADPYAALAAILLGIGYGLTHHSEPGEQVHGNAFMDQYDFPLLPKTLEEAQRQFEAGTVVQNFLEQKK